MSGLVLYLERRGIAVRVDRFHEDRYGAHRVHKPDATLRAALTVAADEDFEEVSTRPHLRLIAYWGTRSRDERQTILTRHAELPAAFQAGRISFEALRRSLASLPLGSAVVFSPNRWPDKSVSRYDRTRAHLDGGTPRRRNAELAPITRSPSPPVTRQTGTSERLSPSRCGVVVGNEAEPVSGEL